jgi:hypothetical protein
VCAHARPSGEWRAQCQLQSRQCLPGIRLRGRRGGYFARYARSLLSLSLAVESGESVHSFSNGYAVTSVAWHPSKLLLAYTGKDKDRYDAVRLVVLGIILRHERETGVIKAFGMFV